MRIDWNIVVAVGMPILTLFLGAWINHLFECRPKLISYLGFISSHRLPPQADGNPGPIVNTHSVIIKNMGRKTAINVRLGHTFLPSFNVYPDIAYNVIELPGGGKEIVFPALVPRKEVHVNYLYFAPVTWQGVNTHIESDDGLAKVVAVLLQPLAKPLQIKITWVLVVVGVISTTYLLFECVHWLITK